MREQVDEELIRELAQPYVEEFSPAEEGELFVVLSEAHFAEPQAYARTDQRTSPLSFGLPELAVLMTPVLLAAMTEVVRYLMAEALARGVRVSARAIRRLFGRPDPGPPDDEQLMLTPEQWRQVRAIVEGAAKRGGVSPDRAQLIADAVVGQGRAAGDADDSD
jgi:hypothetical protein